MPAHLPTHPRAAGARSAPRGRPRGNWSSGGEEARPRIIHTRCENQGHPPEGDAMTAGGTRAGAGFRGVRTAPLRGDGAVWPRPAGPGLRCGRRPDGRGRAGTPPTGRERRGRRRALRGAGEGRPRGRWRSRQGLPRQRDVASGWSFSARDLALRGEGTTGVDYKSVANATDTGIRPCPAKAGHGRTRPPRARGPCRRGGRGAGSGG